MTLSLQTADVTYINMNVCSQVLLYHAQINIYKYADHSFIIRTQNDLSYTGAYTHYKTVVVLYHMSLQQTHTLFIHIISKERILLNQCTYIHTSIVRVNKFHCMNDQLVRQDVRQVSAVVCVCFVSAFSYSCNNCIPY